MLQQLRGLAGVFASDDGNFFAQNTQGAQRYIFQVADGRRDDVESGGQTLSSVVYSLGKMHPASEPEEKREEAPLYVRWNPDRSPYLIELRLELVSKIAEQIGEAKDGEIGGLLFGTAPTAENQILRIDDFEGIPSADGRSYMLDPALQEKFAQLRWTGNHQRHAVGFFRTTSRSGTVRPSIGDQSLVANQFKDGIAAILLITQKAPREGAFYIVRNGQIPDEPSVQEFAFDYDSFSALPEIEPDSWPEEEEGPLSVWAFVDRFKWIGIAAAGVLLCVIAFFSFTRARQSNGLDLSITPGDNLLEISWNHSDAQVERAVDATLMIGDGSVQRRIHLYKDELKLGSVDYQTTSQHVKVSLALNMPGSVSFTQSLDWGGVQ